MGYPHSINLPVDFAERHARLLADFLATEKPTEFSHPAMFANHRMLPCMNTPDGCTGIRADGEIVFFLWEIPGDLQIETDPRLRNMAVFQGAQRFPELAILIPPRPADAITCGSCHGTGIPPDIPPKLLHLIACYCGGLGWLPPGTPPTP